MLESQLTSNFLRDVVVLRKTPENSIVQVLSLKKTHQKGDPNAISYKLSINDGTCSYNAFLHSHFNKYIDSGRLKQFTIIKITKYTSKIFGLHHSFIILGFEILDSQIDHIIGDPKQISSQPENQRLSESQPCVPEVFHLLTDLSPYILNWSIKARVTRKSPIKTFRVVNGQRRSFSVVLKDTTGTEIEAVFYDGDLERFYDLLVLENVYCFSNGIVVQNSNKYGYTANDYTIKFGSRAKIIEVPDLGDIGFLSYNYMKLADIVVHKPKIVDFLGVVTQIYPVEKIDSKYRTNISKRSVELCDQSNLLIDLTLWDDQADNFPENGNFVLSLKGARISTYRGVSLTALSTTLIDTNPSGEMPDNLRKWFENAKSSVMDMEKVSRSGTFASPLLDLKEASQVYDSFKGESFYHSFCGMVIDISVIRKLYYCACPNPHCRGKGLYSPEPDLYLCERCHQRVEHPRHRYAFSMVIADHTGSIRVSLLGNDILGEKIIGRKIDDWVQETKDLTDIQIRTLLCPVFFNFFKLKLRTKLDTFNAETRVKTSVFQGDRLSFGDAALQIANIINSKFV